MTVIPTVVNPAIFVEKRPWGHFERYTLNEPCTVKLVYVEPGKRLSLQYHNNRDEFWKVIKGPAEVRTGNKIRVLQQGESVMIPRKTVHRLGNNSSSGGRLDNCDVVVIMEISYGQFDEADIVRLEDDHSRQTDKITPEAQ
jgi:mannose-6-phosphate isomerase-like protein (cupin superfamily)